MNGVSHAVVETSTERTVAEVLVLMTGGSTVWNLYQAVGSGNKKSYRFVKNLYALS